MHQRLKRVKDWPIWNVNYAIKRIIQLLPKDHKLNLLDNNYWIFGTERLFKIFFSIFTLDGFFFTIYFCY